MGLALKEAVKNKKAAKTSSSRAKRERVEIPEPVSAPIEDDQEIVAGMHYEDIERRAEEALLKVENTPEAVPPFECGFVHPALKDSMNVNWRKTTEVDILASVMERVLRVDGVFIGSIYAKPSFAHRERGGMLL